MVFFVEMAHMEYGFRGHPSMNFSLSMQSLAMLHNETMSIYSHLFASLYFVFLLLCLVGLREWSRALREPHK